MSRELTIERAERYFDEGGFFADLARRVAIPTESQNPCRPAGRCCLPRESKIPRGSRYFRTGTAT